MHYNFLDRFSRIDSPFHRLPAGLKLAFALLSIVAAIAIPPSRAIYLIGVTAAWLAIAAVSRIPWTFLLRRLLLLEPFVLGAAMLALFQPDGWRHFGVLVSRCTLCLLIMILLSNTTPFAELLRVLKRLRVPALLITTLALMYRYLFVLMDEAERMKRARQSRTFSRGRRRRWQTTASIVGQLFVRSSERAERIYAAMCARGWR